MNAADFTAAALLAARRHAGQTRKAGDVPYVNHVIEAADLVARDGQGDEAVIGALLHDVVEDSEETVEGLRERFGDPVAAIVDALTDDPEWEGLDRPRRKALQAEHIAHAPAAARAVKIADQTSNLFDVASLPAAWDAAEAGEYIEGAERVVDACRDAAPDLAARFDDAARRARAAWGLS